MKSLTQKRRCREQTADAKAMPKRVPCSCPTGVDRVAESEGLLAAAIKANIRENHTGGSEISVIECLYTHSIAEPGMDILNFAGHKRSVR